MARGARTKPDGLLAPQIVIRTLKLLGGLLSLVGKPFYLLISGLVIVLLFIAFLVGRGARISFLKISSFGPKKLSLPKIPRLKVRLKPKRLPLPKLEFPRPWVLLKILLLKLKLFVITTVPPSPPIPRMEPGVVPRRLFLFGFVFLLLFTFWSLILKDLPSPQTLLTRDQEVSTKIYDRNGVLLYKIYKDKNRTLVSLSAIPLHVRLATLAAEDAEFYSHPGFSVRGIARAVFRNLLRGELSGGSTITQQLVKNALLSSEKTIVRKIREIILSVRVELTFSKDEILEMYLNEVSYGGTAYGIEEASQVYFAKTVSELTVAEAGFLAGLPKSPTKFSPFGDSPELSFSRQKEVLKLMRINKYLSGEEEEKALKQQLSFAPNRTEIKAPHFVMYVRQVLAEKYGEEVLEKGGLEVTTTLDYSIQQLAEKVVKEEVEKLARLRVGNGAALVLNPKTGEILAMVGSKDYFDTASDGNVNVTLRPRQPGSSIKIVNYAYALSRDFTPSTILDDTPVTFSVPGQPPYSPKNYDGAYRGKLSLRSALAESRNVPAVKVLASYGVDKMLEMGKKMGITTWEEKGRFGLSLTLGGGEVKLLELAQAFATVANYGKRPEIVPVLKVTNREGRVLEEHKCGESNFLKVALAAEAKEVVCEGEQVLDPRVAYLLIDILKDNRARAPAFGASSFLMVPNHPEVAVKTGTSNDLKDNLTLGFNQRYLVATWVGNNDSSPMSRIASGVTGASPIWNKIISALLAKEVNHDWEVPKGLARVNVCSLTGTLPCEGCAGISEWFLEEKVPQRACLKETVEKIREEQEKEGQILEPASSTQAPF